MKVILVTVVVVMVHVLAIMALDIIKGNRFQQVFGMLMDGILIKTDNYCLGSAGVQKLNVMPQGWDISGCWVSKNFRVGIGDNTLLNAQSTCLFV